MNNLPIDACTCVEARLDYLVIDCPFLLNDIFSERRKSQCGHLEMLSAERNADNRDAQQ